MGTDDGLCRNDQKDGDTYVVGTMECKKNYCDDVKKVDDEKFHFCISEDEWTRRHMEEEQVVKSGFAADMGDVLGSTVVLIIALFFLCFALYWIVRILHYLVLFVRPARWRERRADHLHEGHTEGPGHAPGSLDHLRNAYDNRGAVQLDHNVDSDASCRAGYHHAGADVAFDARREYRHDLHGVHRVSRVRIPGRDPGVDLPPALQHPGHYDLVSDPVHARGSAWLGAVDGRVRASSSVVRRVLHRSRVRRRAPRALLVLVASELWHLWSDCEHGAERVGGGRDVCAHEEFLQGLFRRDRENH